MGSLGGSPSGCVQPGAARSLASDNANEVLFKLYRSNAIVVRGSVGNLKNLNFLIDT